MVYKGPPKCQRKLVLIGVGLVESANMVGICDTEAGHIFGPIASEAFVMLRLLSYGARSSTLERAPSGLVARANYLIGGSRLRTRRHVSGTSPAPPSRRWCGGARK
jgi:hypothetical protein